MLERNDIRTYEADDVVMRSLNNKNANYNEEIE